ncbi:MAG: hypothetical protein SOZ08_07550 [Erysipelotrichaceae bacterium]|nr:hypothetical protein [Erysipelotrichaceae bacterium]
MKIINNIPKGIDELKKEAHGDPKLNISRRLRFDFPELMEDKAALSSSLDRLDLSAEKKIELIADARKIQEHLIETREHTAGYKPDPWKEFKKHYHAAYNISRTVFNEVFNAVNQVQLKKYEETNCDKSVAAFVNTVMHIEQDPLKRLQLISLSFCNFKLFAQKIPQDYEPSSARALTAAAFQLWKKGPTAVTAYVPDALAALKFDENNNDYFLENNVVYYKFSSALNVKKDSALIISPSEFFIKKWCADNDLQNIQTYFTIQDKTELNMLSLRKQRNINWISFLDIESFIKGHGALLRNILIFGNHIEAANAMSVIDTCQQEHLRIENLMVFTSDAYVNDLQNSGRFDLSLLSSAWIFPAEINHGTHPSRKLLLNFCLDADQNAHIRLYKYALLDNGKNQYLLRKPYVIEAEQDEVENYTSLRDAYAAFEADRLRKTDQIRRQAQNIQFTDEITLKLTVSIKGNHTARISAFALDPVTGRELPGTRASKKSIPADQAVSWVKYEYPYIYERKKDGSRVSIRKNITDAYLPYLEHKRISLKTFVYLYPECDKIIGNNKDIFIVLNSILGSYSPGDIISEIMNEALDLLYGSFPGLGKKYEIQQMLSSILDLAVQEGYAAENRVKETVENISNQTKALYEVRNALVRKHLDQDQMMKIMNTCIRRFSKGDSKALAVMIKLLTGLETSVVTALKWKDLRYVKDFDSYQLLVQRAASFDGKTVNPFSKKEAYRKVPLPAFLTDFLLEEKDRQKKLFNAVDDKQLKEQSIISGGSHSINGVMAIWSPSQLNEYIRRLMKPYIGKEMILLPSEKNEFEEVDLRNYNGDIFRSNFRHYALSRCGYQKDEVDYLTGNKPDSTFARNYCDYANDAVQYHLRLKQDRFANLFSKAKDATLSYAHLDGSVYQTGCDPHHWTQVSFIVERGNDDEIQVRNQHGFTVDIEQVKNGGEQQ